MDGNPRTILLVEDEMIIAQAERMALQQAGYHVIHVGSGEDAVATVGNGGRIDLILMDVHLGQGMDGIDAAAEILRHRTVPILFLSAYTDAATIERAEGIGGYGYAAKGLINTLLLSQIRSTIRLFQTKRAETEALREDQRVLEVLLHALPAYVWHKDRAGRYVHVNTAFCEVIRVAPDQAIGKSDDDFFSPENAEKHRCNDETIMRTGQAVRGIQTTYLSADGECRHSLVDKVPVFDDGGTVVGTVGLGIDVTAIKVIEAELRRSEEQLLLAKTHIGSVRALHEKLLQNYGQDRLAVGPYLREIAATVVEAGGPPDVRITTSLDDIELNSDVVFPVGTVAIELLTNCLKHAFAPGTPGTIDLALRRSNGSAVLQVADDGGGLPADFDAGRADNFGISIVRMFAARLGGAFEIAARPEGGTRCMLTFPLQADTGPRSANPVPAERAAVQPSL